MNDNYNELLRQLHRRQAKVEPMKHAAPPPLPNDKRLSDEDIARAVQRFREMKASEGIVQ